MGLCSLSENSEESSSWPFIIASQGLQTRIVPVWLNRSPGINSVHLESKICPHVRQWCFRRNVEKGSPQWKQSFAFSSRIQNSLLSSLLRSWDMTPSPLACGRQLLPSVPEMRSTDVFNGAKAGGPDTDSAVEAWDATYPGNRLALDMDCLSPVLCLTNGFGKSFR